MNLNGVDQEIIDKMNRKFQVSDAYTQAMNYTQGLLDKVNSGKTSYTEQLNQLTQNYANKPKFQYDMNTDTLFQNALSSAMGQGKNAMQDAIGQASALTGGYASSSAQAVGNQAYNTFIKGAYDNLPAFYQMSLDAYNSEDQRMLNQINLIKDADATEYGRLRDAYALNKDKADTLYNREYQTFNDDRSHATQMASLQNTDWWKKTEYDRAVEEARLQREFQAEQNRLSREQSAKQFAQEMDYKYTSSGYTKDAKGNWVAPATETETEPMDLYTYSRKETDKNGKTWVYFTDSNGKEFKKEKGVNPYNGHTNEDVKNGTFKNGYQPDNIDGKKLTDSGKAKVNINGRLQTVWQTTQKIDGGRHTEKKYWIWDGIQNQYVAYK